MTWRRPLRRIGWVAALLVVGAAAGCTSTGEPSGSLLGPTPTLNTPPPSPTPAASATPADVALLTGLPGVTTRPAVVVPIRIAAGTGPAVGLGDADIVSMEFSEAGALRLTGVFASAASAKVGPLTMVRPSDAKIFSQTNPVFTETGSPAGFVTTVTSDHLSLVSAKRGRTGFTTHGNDYYVDTARVATSNSKLLSTSMFQYAAGGQSVATSGVTTVTKLAVRVPGHTAVTWTYNATSRLWTTTLFGTSGEREQCGRADRSVHDQGGFRATPDRDVRQPARRRRDPHRRGRSEHCRYVVETELQLGPESAVRRRARPGARPRTNVDHHGALGIERKRLVTVGCDHRSIGLAGRRRPALWFDTGGSSGEAMSPADA